MLPALARPQLCDYKPTEVKIYQLPREMSQEKQRRQPFQSYRQSAKAKIGGGFKLSTNKEEARVDSLRINEYVTQQSKTMNLVQQQRKGPTNLKQEIKMIEKTIRQCQRKIDEEKRRKEEKQQQPQDHRQDFEEVIRREMKLQGYSQAVNNKHFDYLTNPGGPQGEPQQTEQAQEPEVTRQPYSIAEGLQKLERFYQNSLKKKFQRRESFPHQACRRKNPKLHITPKTNTVAKRGRPMTEQQHKFRVMTRQTTPQEIYPVIPNFAVVKDNLSKNIVAYLGDYKPFLDKTKEKIQNQSDSDLQILESSGKSITIAT